MDRATILEQLKGYKCLDESMYNILHAIFIEISEFEIEGNTLPIYIEQVIDSLIPFSCDKCIKVYKPRESSNNRIIIDTERLTEKSMVEKILDKIVIILLKLCYKSEIASEYVLESIMEHITSHFSCLSIHSLMLKLILLSDQIKQTVKELDIASMIVSQLELILSQPESPVLPSQQQGKHDRKNSEVLPVGGSPIPPDYLRVINKSIFMDNESFLGELPMLHGHTVSSRELRRVAKRKMEDSRPRSPVVPMLNIPQESTRSNKRWEFQKSISYRSGRISGLSGS